MPRERPDHPRPYGLRLTFQTPQPQDGNLFLTACLALTAARMIPHAISPDMIREFPICHETSPITHMCLICPSRLICNTLVLWNSERCSQLAAMAWMGMYWQFTAFSCEWSMIPFENSPF